LAIPLVLLVGSTAAARQGIYFKSASSLEKAGSSFDVVALDKTGTLTTGNLKVSDFHVREEMHPWITKERVITLIADIETFVEHPVGTSFWNRTNRSADFSWLINL
jgi:P-type Cu2+ transporter